MSSPTNAERKRLAASIIAGRDRLERQLARVKREFERLLESYAKGFAEEHEVKDRLAELRAERKRLEEELQSADKPPEFVSLHPAAITRYREQVERLADALRKHSANGNDEPAAALRELVERIIVMPKSESEPLKLELRGRLASLLGHDVFPQARAGGGGEGGSGGPFRPRSTSRCVGLGGSGGGIQATPPFRFSTIAI